MKTQKQQPTIDQTAHMDVALADAGIGALFAEDTKLAYELYPNGYKQLTLRQLFYKTKPLYDLTLQDKLEEYMRVSVKCSDVMIIAQQADTQLMYEVTLVDNTDEQPFTYHDLVDKPLDKRIDTVITMPKEASEKELCDCILEDLGILD